MKLKRFSIMAAVFVFLAGEAPAQTYDTNNVVVQTFAGSGFSGYVDGVGQLTMFKNPSAVVADTSSNLFVWDSGNHRIRKITPDGTVTTFAGGGASNAGYGTNVSIPYAIGSMTIDHANTIWAMCDPYLFRITSDAYVSYTNLTGLNYLGGICADSANNIYYSDWGGNKIYRYKTNAVLEVFAGSGNQGSANGNGIFSSFYRPGALASDAADNIYVWDSYNGLIRKIDQSQNVTTFSGKYGFALTKADGAGTNAAFSSISAMCFDGAGGLILADDSCIRKISPTTNTLTLAGSFAQVGYTNGAGNVALFYNPAPSFAANGVCISQDMIFVADSGNQRIRQISFDPSAQIVSGANLGIGTFAGVTITGVVGRTYQVQSSPDMNAWTTQATLLLNSSPYLWIDQNPVSGNKFYRALLLP